VLHINGMPIMPRIAALGVVAQGMRLARQSLSADQVTMNMVTTTHSRAKKEESG
jgi:hypothetical protein